MTNQSKELLLDIEETSPPSPSTAASNQKYTVVARRYRPKTFEELIGQDTVAHALMRAIETHRVGHAYLFTGARGVGKTSTARIFAKALNASHEGNGRFDPSSDVALAIDSGEDMDVIEIDGASNRGIDEIRQLRANAAIRPTRSPFKIYIIDEVHMLTTPAFNALLKTLEEPPGHVKFIFCTTDPEKIPITVLSRCQRFDFPPVRTDQILERLQFICNEEGTEADEAALRLIARRAAGSMRDSQSLLEQLLSFGGNRITVDDVHSMLGTADEARLASIATRLIERDAAGAITELDSAMTAGVDAGQLAEQMLGYLRDMMAVSVGGSADLVRTANPNTADQLREWGKAWGTMTLLSALQLLDETIVRMKHSLQSRILLEVALVQICNLQDLQSLADVVKAITAHQAPPPMNRPVPTQALSPRPASIAASVPSQPQSEPTTVAKKKADEVVDEVNESELVAEPSPDPEPNGESLSGTLPEAMADGVRESSPTISSSTISSSTISSSTISSPTMTSPLQTLLDAAASLEGLVKQCASMAVDVVETSTQKWRVKLSSDAGFALGHFRLPENSRRLLSAIRDRVGRAIELDFEIVDGPVVAQGQNPARSNATEGQSNQAGQSQNQLIRQAMTDPLVKRFMDVFDGQVVRVDPPIISVPRPAIAESPTETLRDDQVATTNS